VTVYATYRALVNVQLTDGSLVPSAGAVTIVKAGDWVPQAGAIVKTRSIVTS